jgi:hypothetical protein
MSVLLQSCFKEDEKVPVYKPGELETLITDVGDTYYRQIFVDLNTLEEKASHTIGSWDLAFNCDENQWHVILNSALMMYAGNTQDTNFATIIEEEGWEMKFDVSSGNLDSTSIGKWYQIDGEGQNISLKQVYVINRGIDGDLNQLGYKKIQLDFQDGHYKIRYANLDGTDERVQIVEKDEQYNFTYLSFENGLLNIEPPKDEWALKFSRYSTLLFTDEGDPYDYNVVGVLLNPNQVSAARTSNNFDEIVLQDTASYTFNKQADMIGYNWKLYDFDGASYSIIPDMNYIIKDNNNFYYKLRFISFYDQFGNKGAITYEVKRL